MTDTLADNPVLAPWTGPRGGHPTFAGVKAEHFEPAMEEAMRLYRAELAAIAGNPEAPTFANTLEAMERGGKEYRRVSTLLSIFTSTLNGAAMQAVQRRLAPVMAGFRDEIYHNRALFDRVDAVFRRARRAGSTPNSSGSRTCPISASPARARRSRTPTSIAWRRSTSAWPPSTPAFRRTSLPTRRRGPVRGERRRPRGSARRSGGRRRGGGREARQARPVGFRQHPLVDGPVPDLFGQARAAGKGPDHVGTAAATRATSTTTTPTSARS